MTGKNFVLITVLAVLLSSYCESAENGGFAGEYMYTMGGSAMNLSLGGAGAAIQNTASGLYYNPASIAGMVNKEITLLYTPMLFNVTYSFLGLAYPVSDGSVIGISRTSLDLGGIEKTDSNGAQNGSANLNDACYMLAYGLTLGEGVSLGGAVRIITASLDTYSGTGYGFDLGVQYNILKGYTAGINIQNLIAPQITLNSEPDRYPVNVRAGIAAEVMPKYLNLYGDVLILNILPSTGQYSGTYRMPLLWFTGVEILPVPNLAVRGGINYKEFSAGFGYKTNDFDLDYGASFHELGIAHRVSLSLRFGLLLSESEKWIREKEKEVNVKYYYNRALKYYNEKKYSEARTELNEVFASVPADKESLDLLYRIEGGEKAGLAGSLMENALILFEEGKEGAAKEKIAEAGKYDPEIAFVTEKEYLKKAEELNKKREYSAALKYVARALFINPENTAAKELYTKLKSVLELLK